jgi:hypothetical protein
MVVAYAVVGDTKALITLVTIVACEVANEIIVVVR